MSFEVAGSAYDAFMGRFSRPLSQEFIAAARVEPGDRVLDVGCGPGALTEVLVERLGAEQVTAVDPSGPFVEAARSRLPGVDIRRSSAEELPFPDDTFDAAMAQLVVHFMADPVAGLREMGRVTRPGGAVSACVWDHAGGGPLTTFWGAVHDLDPGAAGEADLAGAREGHLAELAAAAGLGEVEESRIGVTLTFGSLEEWWAPFTAVVGPAGDYVEGLDERGREALLARCAERFGEPPFDIAAHAWCIRASVP